MPESYIEPLTDRQQCYTCHKTVTGKKKLSKCAGCHAITYCSVECQREDRTRHKWNCVPVMVTEIPGKGRGIVAARDIKMGELIFNDKPSIKLPSNFMLSSFLSSGPLDSMMTQVENLPTDAKSQFYKLTAPDTNTQMNAFISILANRNNSDSKALKLFMGNAIRNRKGNYSSLYLNLSLVNHSCAPNAVEGEIWPESVAEDQVPNIELRAIKDISRGEEINTCYVSNIKRFGIGSQKRKAGIKQEMDFDCACSVCSGRVADQKDIMRKLAKLYFELNPLHQYEIVIGREKWEARLQDKIVDLTMELYIGKLNDKIRALDVMVRTAHLARDQNLVRKAMDTWKKLAADTNLADVQMTCQIMENSISQWSKELKSRKAPKREEVDFIYNISFYD